MKQAERGQQRQIVGQGFAKADAVVEEFRALRAAGMSRSEADHAVELIRSVTQGRTLVMVEHDMSVVFNLADRISVLVYGEVIATDVPSRIRENHAVQTAYLGEAAHA